MLWTTDEEIGSGTSRAAIEDEARRSDAVLVLEPSLPGGALKTSRKGCGSYEIAVRGRGGARRHRAAERRERRAGARAPDPASQRAAGSRARRPRQRRAGVGRTALERHSRRGARHGRRARADRGGGGGAGRGDPRLAPRRSAHESPRSTAASIVRRWNAAGSWCVCTSRREAIARELGQTLAEGSTGGGSDGNFTAALGVPTLDGLGAIGDGAHALHEHVEIDALTDRAALVAGLIANLQDADEAA